MNGFGDESYHKVDPSLITCSLIIVMKEHPNGTVDGYWIQDHIGTVKEATMRAKAVNEVNSNQLNIAITEKVNSTTPALNYWHNLKKL